MFSKTTETKQGLTRRDTALCNRMLAVIDQLNEVLTDQAELLALDWDADDPFVKDEAKGDLLHKLVEFLVQGELDADALVGAHQLTTAHARSWFMDDDQDDSAEGIDTRQPAQGQPLYEYCSVEINPTEKHAAAALYRLFDAGWQPIADSE